MKQVLLLDNTDNIIKSFNDYKSANHYRNMYNRPDWSINSSPSLKTTVKSKGKSGTHSIC